MLSAGMAERSPLDLVEIWLPSWPPPVAIANAVALPSPEEVLVTGFLPVDESESSSVLSEVELRSRGLGGVTASLRW